MAFPWFSRVFTRTSARKPPRGRNLVVEVLEDRNLLTVSGPDLIVSQVPNGTFTQGGTAAYTITVQNIGNSATTGTVSLADTLPPGLTATSLTSASPIQQAYYNPSTSKWFRYPSASSFATFPSVPVPGGIPVPADYAGTGTAQLAVYTVVSGVGTWFIQGQPTPIKFGLAGDIPVPADYAGIGKAQIAVYRPSTAQWLILGQPTVTYGAAGLDMPAPADYAGIGRAQIAVYRPSNGNWYVKGAPGPQFFGFPGITSVIPVPGDYLGKGTAQFALYRTDTATWYIKGAAGPIPYGTPFVTRPAPAAYLASGWSIDLNTLTATNNDVLAAGATYPPLKLLVQISSSAPGSVDNLATVSGGGEVNLGNDLATLLTSINPASSLGFSPPSMSLPPFNVLTAYKQTITSSGGSAALQISSFVLGLLPLTPAVIQDSSKGIITISGTPQEIIQSWEAFLETAVLLAKNRYVVVP